jgi:pyruvate kinase
MLREALASIAADGGPAIVAKIETRPAVEDALAILDVADALMVARGDLGVELPFEDVPLVQKRLVRSALTAGRPVIVATQMLESMTAVPRPTRAEASDVANAVFDGADAVMLSAETAIGAYPIEAAEAAIRILVAADGDASFGLGSPVRSLPADDASAVAWSAVELARNDQNVRTLACFTRTGRTAMLLAAQRPRVPILAFCPDPAVRRRLALSHGVEPRPIGDVADTDITRTLSHAVGSSDLLGAAVLVATTAGGGGGPNLIEVVRATTPT